MRKLQYYQEGRSEKHIADIRNMLIVLGDSLERDQIAEYAEKLNLVEEWTRAQASP